MSIYTPLRFVVFLCLSCASAFAQGDKKFLTTRELIELTEKSTHSYKVQTLDADDSMLVNAMNVMYPAAVADVPIVRVYVDKDGSRSYGEYPLTDELVDALRKGNEHFVAERHAEARKEFSKMLTLDPKLYLGYSYVGDTYFSEGDFARALTYYDSAVALNPDHYQAHFFRASALRSLGRMADARKAFTKALARNPRHQMSYAIIGNTGADLGVRLHSKLFEPRGLAIDDGKATRVIVEGKSNLLAAWLMYALAKGVWLAEPDHRLEMTGESKRLGWSSVEEQECLGLLLESYLSLKKDKPDVRDERLDYIVKIVEAGYFTEFALYEFASRIDPHVMLTQSDEMRDRMEKFVEKFVMVER